MIPRRTEYAASESSSGSFVLNFDCLSGVIFDDDSSDVTSGLGLTPRGPPSSAANFIGPRNSFTEPTPFLTADSAAMIPSYFDVAYADSFNDDVEKESRHATNSWR